MKIISKASFLFFISTLLTGCASLLDGETQNVHIRLMCKDINLSATCVASNDLGSWRFYSPGTVVVKRDNSSLNISCRGPSVPRFNLNVVPLPTWAFTGNIVAGGLVGAAVDVYNRAGFAYPENVEISNPACN